MAIVLLSIIATALILFLLYHRSSMARLAMLPEEIIICEERGIAVDEKAARYYHYGNCLVRLTDRRIVIAQKIPFAAQSYLIRFVIEYPSPQPGVDLKSMIVKGYMAARVVSDQITVEHEGAGALISIDIHRAGGGTVRVLTYTTKRAGEYIRAFGGRT